MKSIKVIALLACSLLMTHHANAVIRLDHQGPETGFIQNGLNIHISRVDIICTTGELITGQPLIPGQTLHISKNFDKIKQIVLHIADKKYVLSQCYTDDVDNAMKLEDNRNFNKFVIYAEQGKNGKYYLKCLDTQHPSIED